MKVKCFLLPDPVVTLDCRHSNSMHGLVVLFLLVAIQNLSGQSVSPSKSLYAPGKRIIVNYAGFLGHPKDWIGIATKDMAEDKYLYWQYTPGTSSGTVTFNGMQHGEYEIRAYFDNGGIVKARTMFRVGNADAAVSAKTEKNRYLPTDQIVVSYSGLQVAKKIQILVKRRKCR